MMNRFYILVDKFLEWSFQRTENKLSRRNK